MYDKEESLTQKSFVFPTSQNMELKYVFIKKRNIASRYYSVAVITRDFDDKDQCSRNPGSNPGSTSECIKEALSDKLFPVFWNCFTSCYPAICWQCDYHSIYSEAYLHWKYNYSMLPTCSSGISPLALSSLWDFSTCSWTYSIDLKYLTVFTCNSRLHFLWWRLNGEIKLPRTGCSVLIDNDQSPRM